MSFTTTKTILKYASDHSIAHPAFNVNMPCQAEAIIEACEEIRSACIIQVAEPGLAFIGGNPDFLNGTMDEKKRCAKLIANAVKRRALKSSVPVALHLDHGRSFESCKACIDAGFTSVMIDGSSLSYEDNVKLTAKVVNYAHKKGVSVEAELGVLAGVEDHVFSASSTYTNPMTVVDFFTRTKVDSLALSYGTKHGAVKGDNVKLRKEIVIASMENMRHSSIEGTLVSHGSSLVPQYIVEAINALGGNVTGHGIPLEQLMEVIPSGISKINIDTDIRLAITRNIREYFAKNEDKKATSKIFPLMEAKKEAFEYRYYLRDYIPELMANRHFEGELKDIVPLIKQGVKEIVLTTTVQFGCVGDATKIEA